MGGERLPRAAAKVQHMGALGAVGMACLKRSIQSHSIPLRVRSLSQAALWVP